MRRELNIDSPLAEGGRMYINPETFNTLQEMAKMGAAEALEQFRLSRKMGRDDKGTGDEFIGKVLRQSREHLGYTQSDLAEKAGVHYTTIGKIETGDRGMSLHTFCKVSRWLGSGFTGAVVAYLSESE
jgi:DNA-binding XRE family transcriptional regulator